MVEKNDFIGYEYREVHTKRGLISVYVDGYENFGWSLEDTESPIGKIDTAVLKFKRNRKLCNKAELTIAPYFIYKVLLQKRTEHMNPLIDGKYDELYEVCEKGHNLL